MTVPSKKDRLGKIVERFFLFIWAFSNENGAYVCVWRPIFRINLFTHAILFKSECVCVYMFGVCFFLSHPFISFSPGSNDWIFSPLLCVAGVLCVNFFFCFLFSLRLYVIASLFLRSAHFLVDSNSQTHSLTLACYCFVVSTTLFQLHTHTYAYSYRQRSIFCTHVSLMLSLIREKKNYLCTSMCVCVCFTPGRIAQWKSTTGSSSNKRNERM